MNERIDRVEIEIATKNKLLLLARRKLTADPNNTDAQADIEKIESDFELKYSFPPDFYCG